MRLTPEPVGRKGATVLTVDDERVLAAALAVVAAMTLLILAEGDSLDQDWRCCGAQRGARLMVDAGAVPLARGGRKHLAL